MVTAKTAEFLKLSRLTQRELELLNTIFLQHPDIKRVVLFGSRAKGTAKPYSDIDIPPPSKGDFDFSINKDGLYSLKNAYTLYNRR